MFDTKEYKVLEGVNQSSLKVLMTDPYQYYLLFVAKDPLALKSYEKSKRKKFIMGDLVDAFITDETSINQYCYISSSEAPGEKTAEVVDYIFKNLPTPEPGQNPLTDNLKDYPLLVEEALSKIDFQTNWKMPTRVEKITSGGDKYFKSLFHAQDKEVIGIETYNKAKIVSDIMKEHPHTASYCAKGEFSYFQVPLVAEYLGMKIKGLLDRLKFIDAKTAEIVDYKTAANPKTFRQSWSEYEYGDQAVFYEGLVKFNYPQINLLPTKFVVGFHEAYTNEHETNPIYYPRPIVYTMNEADYAHSLASIKAKLEYRLECEKLAWDFDKIQSSYTK